MQVSVAVCGGCNHVVLTTPPFNFPKNPQGCPMCGAGPSTWLPKGNIELPVQPTA